MKTAADGMVQLKISDGSAMSAYAARPEGPRKALGLIILQEIFGVNGYIKSVADRFAAEGYLAVAPELFHRTEPGFQAAYGDAAKGMEHKNAMTIPGMEADLAAAHAWLESQGATETAAVGFCMGGFATFVGATSLPLRCAVSFYGGGIAPKLLDRAPKLSGKILLLWGGKDKHIPPEQRRAVADALRAAGKPFIDVEFAAADHGFFCDARASYHPESAKEAWALVKAFLEEPIGQ